MTVKELKELLEGAKDDSIVRVKENMEEWEYPVIEVEEEPDDFILIFDELPPRDKS